MAQRLSTGKGKVITNKIHFQWFIDHLKTIYPDKSLREIIDKYPTPQMVMIGSESTGKSTTLENLTKTVIFPSHHSTCTRCPIRVVMVPTKEGETPSSTVTFRGEVTQVADLSLLKKKIEKLFILIGSTSTSGYTEDEVTITFVQPGVFRIDLIDLPGIVSYPPPAREFTTSLCLRYIKNPNSFLLCVVPATIPRLNSYEPIARILENNAANRTIIVLTMADKVQPKDYDVQLISRVAMSSDELIGTQKFLSCCAVVNRADSAVDLTEQPALESAWFAEHITPKLTQFNKELVSERLGMANLQVVSNEQYEAYIREQWLPRTAKEIEENIAKLQQEITAIGEVVTVFNLGAFNNHLIACNTAMSMYNSCMSPLPTTKSAASPMPTNFGSGAPTFGSPSVSASYNMIWGIPLTFEALVSPTFADAILEQLLTRIAAYKVTVTSAQVSTFQQSKNHRDTWQLQRFAAHWKTTKALLCTIMTACMKPALQVLQPLLLQQFLNKTTSADSTISALATTCREKFLAQYTTTVQQYTTVQDLVESDDVTQQRADLHLLVQKNKVVLAALQSRLAKN